LPEFHHLSQRAKTLALTAMLIPISTRPNPSASPERVPHASEETALNPEPFDLVEGVIPLQSRILEASLHVAERLASYIFDQGLARARQVDAVRT
jgi:hypothetical protein